MDTYLNTNAHLEAQVSILRADLDHWVKKWSDQNEQLNTVVGELAEREAEILAYRTVLHELACLGNGDSYGNSIGNELARSSLGSQP